MKIENLFNIENKIAVVTGGSRGIGEMITAGFLANGVKVYISARKAPALIDKAKELSDKYQNECISKGFSVRRFGILGPFHWAVSYTHL